MEPGFFDLLARAALDGPTPWVLAALVAMVVAVSRLPAGRRPSMKLPIALLLLHAITTTAGAAATAAGYAAQTYWIAAYALELFAGVAAVSVLVFRVTVPQLGWRVPRILIDIVTAIAVIVALIAVGKRAGLSLAGLITTSAVLTAVLGFALQDTLGNIMGGIALQLDQSIDVGDWISLGPGTPPGKVVEIRWRYTAIETHAWTTILIPNSQLVKGTVTVLGRRQGEPHRVRRDVDFYVEVAVPPGEVIEAVHAALVADPVANMVTEPPVQVLLYGVAEGRGWYKVRYWLIDIGVDDPTDAAVRARVWYALRRAGHGFSIPAQHLLVTAQDEAHLQRRDDRELRRRLDAIARVDLLASLDEEERRQLAGRLRDAPFRAGEAMTREGDADDGGLFVIVAGRAAVRIGAGATAREVAQLGPGQFFGEMSLMTGEKRSATVVALTDVVTYRIDKVAFEALVRSRPEIADDIADLLAERRSRLLEAREASDDLSRSGVRARTKNDILGRIRGFFNLGAGR